jgi:hypothetical protein
LEFLEERGEPTAPNLKPESATENPEHEPELYESNNEKFIQSQIRQRDLNQGATTQAQSALKPEFVEKNSYQ